MRRSIPFFLLAAAAVSAFAADNSYRMNKITSTDKEETYEYTYDANNRVVMTLSQLRSYPEYTTIAAIYRNEKGLQVREQLYQDMEVTWSKDTTQFHNNGYITYAYNDADQLVERINYHNFSKEETPAYTLGGVITYAYDADGNLVKETIYWDLAKTDLFQEIRYIYENGHRIRQEVWMSDFLGNLTNDRTTEMSYYDNGLLKSRKFYTRSAETGQMSMQGETVWEYDAAGNPLFRTSYSPSGGVTEKEDYVYNEAGVPCAFADVVFPYNIEDGDNNEFYHSITTLAPSSHTSWKINQNDNTLQIYAVYEYHYEAAQNGVGSISADNAFRFGIAAFGSDMIRLNGVDNGEEVRIYDMAGRLVMSARQNAEGINISGLAKGQYCVSTTAGAVKISK